MGIEEGWWRRRKVVSSWVLCTSEIALMASRGLGVGDWLVVRGLGSMLFCVMDLTSVYL